jgi:hypothetical protein
MSAPQGQEIWFARRWPLERGGARMVPVHWKGYRAFALFFAMMVLGAIGWGLLALRGQGGLGLALYIAFAIAGVTQLFLAVARHSDNTRTYKDYKAGNASH